MPKKILFLACVAVACATTAHAAPKKSLYERLGGIHKIAKAASICIDVEYTDPMYETNPAFKAGKSMAPVPLIKFTLANTLSHLAGGPQKMVMDIAQIDKGWGFSPELRAHAWKQREKAFLKAGYTQEEFAELRKLYEKHYNTVEPMQPMMENFAKPGSLYARLGGIGAISLVVDDFVNRLATDPTITANPHVVKSLTTGSVTGEGLKYLVTEQLAAATGGPYTYSGRTMKASHTGLMVSEDEWKAGAGILKKVLDKYNVPSKEQGEVFAAIIGTHDDIVGH